MSFNFDALGLHVMIRLTKPFCENKRKKMLEGMSSHFDLVLGHGAGFSDSAIRSSLIDEELTRFAALL